LSAAHFGKLRKIKYIYKRLKEWIKRETQIFNLGEKVKEHQQNYLQHILRMPTYRIPQKLSDYHPKGGRESSTTKEMEGSI
jgi:hypothetical protein